MERRTVLTALLASATGCLGSPPEDDEPVVEYEDLSDHDRRFVDESAEQLAIRWIGTPSGRVYIRRDPESNAWVEAEDSVRIDHRDPEFRDAVTFGYVKKDGERYSFSRTVADGGTYAERFHAERTDDCETVVTVADLPTGAAELAPTLLTAGDAWIASRKYEAVADVDAYYDDRAALDPFEELSERPTRCLEHEGSYYRISQRGYRRLHSYYFTLNRVDDET